MVRRMCIHSFQFFIFCFVSLCLIFSVLSTEKCEDVKKLCMSRIGCGMAMHNFILGCEENLSKESECTPNCKRALLSLLHSEDNKGLNFINCNCANDTHCETRKQRIEKCETDVMAMLDKVDDKDSVVSCTLAKWICEADTSCLAALQYYEENCSSLFRGVRCTARCNNSLKILNQQKKAQKLKTCNCEGTERYNCEELRYNTDVLCYNISRGYYSHSTHSANGAAPYMFPCCNVFVILLLSCFVLRHVL